MKHQEIIGAQRGIDALLKAVDRATLQARQRYERLQDKPDASLEQQAAAYAQWEEMHQTCKQWRYMIQGRMDDLKLAAQASAPDP